jgi:hypothetical protein
MLLYAMMAFAAMQIVWTRNQAASTYGGGELVRRKYSVEWNKNKKCGTEIVGVTFIWESSNRGTTFDGVNESGTCHEISNVLRPSELRNGRMSSREEHCVDSPDAFLIRLGVGSWNSQRQIRGIFALV